MSDVDTIGEFDQTYLSEQFLAFQAELVAFKRMLATGPAGAAGSVDSGEDGARDDAQRQPEQVGHRLLGFLEWQDAQALGLGGRYVHENNDEARYLKVALADEALVALDGWEYSVAWIDHLLELRLFGTRCAGDRVFEAIDMLLRERVAARREMAMLYLFAISIGFQGRYRGTADGGRVLHGLRQELYRFASGHLPDPAFGDARLLYSPDLGRRLLPQAYRYTLDDGVPQMLPNPRRWVLIFMMVAALLLLVSYWIWVAQTAELTRHFDGRGAMAGNVSPAPRASAAAAP